jgi:hypothetical protein
VHNSDGGVGCLHRFSSSAFKTCNQVSVPFRNVKLGLIPRPHSVHMSIRHAYIIASSPHLEEYRCLPAVRMGTLCLFMNRNSNLSKLFSIIEQFSIARSWLMLRIYRFVLPMGSALKHPSTLVIEPYDRWRYQSWGFNVQAFIMTTVFGASSLPWGHAISLGVCEIYATILILHLVQTDCSVFFRLVIPLASP